MGRHDGPCRLNGDAPPGIDPGELLDLTGCDKIARRNRYLLRFLENGAQGRAKAIQLIQ